MFVAEIFESIHGEVNGHHQGRITTFIRLSGCNLKCPYCDTKKTWDPLYGLNLTVPAILEQVQSFGNKYICLTGGEPLLDEKMAIELLKVLWRQGYHISVETNGTIDITPFFRYVESFVIDYKLHIIPDNAKRIKSNFQLLRNTDVIKFVVNSKEEAIQSFYIKGVLEKTYNTNPIFAFSPVDTGIKAKELLSLILEEKVNDAVLSLQIHKIVGLR